jgi:RNA polymerase sigma-70 factor (ECF subfamily)
LTEKDLAIKAELAMQGDEAAFAEICAVKFRDLYFAALVMLGSKEDAEDAVQDAMLSIFRNIGKLKNPKAFSAWTHKILHDSCVDIIRKSERRVYAIPLNDDIISDIECYDRDLAPEAVIGDKELSLGLYEAILSLPEKSREAFVLYYFGDMKYKDIAAATGSSVKTVSTNLIRAKKKLKIYLINHYPDMASLAVLIPAIKAGTLAEVSGGGIASIGAKLKGGGFIIKEISKAISSNFAATATATTAGAACAATVTYAVLAVPVTAPDYEILLSGDCECGHINPKKIELNGVLAGDRHDSWELLSSDGDAIYAGNIVSITEYINSLEKSQRHGHYTLRCVVTRENGKRYAMSRNITIGNLAGDE